MTNAAAALVLLASLSTAPACMLGNTEKHEESCDQLRSLWISSKGHAPVSGVYSIYHKGDLHEPYLAYCDMETGATYLPLPRMGETNYSELSTVEGTLRTSWKMLRLDPLLMLVDVSDHRFASTTWKPVADAPAPEITELPYGVAVSHEGAAAAGANIDLRGTNLSIDQLFTGKGPVTTYTGQVADVIVKDRQWLSATAEPEHAYDARDRELHLAYDACPTGKCGEEEIVDNAADAAGIQIVENP